MSPTCRKGLAGAAALLCSLMMNAAPAAALPVTYDFTIRWFDGAWSEGSFGFDSAIVPPGGGTLAATGLLTNLSIDLAGRHFDETTANTGLMIFSPIGELYVVFGNECWAGGCETGLEGEFQWDVAFAPIGGFHLPLPPGVQGLAFSVDDTVAPYIENDGDVLLGHVKPVPEPSSLALFGMGVIGLGIFCRRQRSYPP